MTRLPAIAALFALGCGAPPAPPPPAGTSTTATGTSATTAAPAEPAELHVVGDLEDGRLIVGHDATVSLSGAAPGAAITVWYGSFGGTTCVPAGPCLPVANAVSFLTGTADAYGDFEAPSTFPGSLAADSWPVFVASVDDLASLPVMRRVFATDPIMSDTFRDGPFPIDVPVELPPGDWLDQGLDSFAIFTTSARAGQTLALTIESGDGHLEITSAITDPEVVNVLEDGASYVASPLADDTWTWFVNVSYYDEEANGLFDAHVRVRQPTAQLSWYPDADGDLWGDGAPTSAWSQPPGTALRTGDCDDTQATVHPEAWEVCDTVDMDCDGVPRPCHAAPHGDVLVDEVAAMRFRDEGVYNLDSVVVDADGDGTAELTVPGPDGRALCTASPGVDVAAADCAWELHSDDWDSSFGWNDGTSDLDHDGAREWLVSNDGVHFLETPLSASPVPADAVAELPYGTPGWGADVTGDGLEDLLFGTPDGVYLIEQLPAPGASLADSATAVWSVDNLARIVPRGDTNGDGIGDTLVTDLIQVWVADGGAPADRDLASDADATITSGKNPQWGDVDGDGYDDAILGDTDPDLLLAIQGPVSGTVDPSTAFFTASIEGSGAADVPAPGDLDGDGALDLAFVDYDYGIGRGPGYILYGPLAGAVDAVAAAGATLDGGPVTPLASARFAAVDGPVSDDLVLLGDGAIWVILGP